MRISVKEMQLLLREREFIFFKVNETKGNGEKQKHYKFSFMSSCILMHEMLMTMMQGWKR